MGLRKRTWWRLVYKNPGAFEYRTKLDYPCSEWRENQDDPYFMDFARRCGLAIEPAYSHYEPEFCPSSLWFKSCSSRSQPASTERIAIERKPELEATNAD